MADFLGFTGLKYLKFKKNKRAKKLEFSFFRNILRKFCTPCGKSCLDFNMPVC